MLVSFFMICRITGHERYPAEQLHDFSSDVCQGLATYKTMYIDAIATAITSKAAYKDLRIAAVVEPDSLPNMITNMNVAACAEVGRCARIWLPCVSHIAIAALPF